MMIIYNDDNTVYFDDSIICNDENTIYHDWNINCNIT